MMARGLLLAFCTAAAAARAESPEFFDAFRDKAFLQGDASYVAREKSSPPEAAPLFRLRWVVLRYAGFSEKEREFWPYRNLLLVTLPSGARYVVESSFGFVDETHLEEERPWQRVAAERAAFEVWASGASTPGEGSAADGGPCEGMQQRIRAPGGSLVFFGNDLSSRTVRASLAEIVAGTFDESERRDLHLLLALSPESNPSLAQTALGLNVRNAALAVSVALRDQVLPPDRRTVVLAPDPAPPADLASWRGIAHLPLDLPPFPALPQTPQ